MIPIVSKKNTPPADHWYVFAPHPTTGELSDFDNIGGTISFYFFGQDQSISFKNDRIDASTIFREFNKGEVLNLLKALDGHRWVLYTPHHQSLQSLTSTIKDHNPKGELVYSKEIEGKTVHVFPSGPNIEKLIHSLDD